MPATVIFASVDKTKIPVIFEKDGRLPIVFLQLVFRHSGSMTDAKPGVAKMAAMLLGEGTRAEGSTAFVTALENRAVSLSASCGNETMTIILGALKSEFDFALKKLTELLRDPNTTQEAFEKIQHQKIGSLSQKQSDFDYLAHNELMALLFEGTPLQYPQHGTVESIQSITLDDLVAHLNIHMGCDHLMAVVGGDLSEEEALKAIEQCAEVLPKAAPAPLLPANPRSVPETRRRIVSTEQAYVYFGAPYHMNYDDPRRYMGRVASFVLGSSGFGSRLMEEIRVKRGLAYSVHAHLAVNHTHSYLTGHLQTKLESEEEAIAAVKEVVETFVREGVTADELEAAKLFLLGSEPLRNETLQQRLGRAFGEYYDAQPLGHQKEELALIDAVTLEEINSFIAEHSEMAALSFAVVTAEMSS